MKIDTPVDTTKQSIEDIRRKATMDGLRAMVKIELAEAMKKIQYGCEVKLDSSWTSGYIGSHLDAAEKHLKMARVLLAEMDQQTQR